MISLTEIVAIIVENALGPVLLSIASLIWNRLGRPMPNPPESLENFAQSRMRKVALGESHSSTRFGKLTRKLDLLLINGVLRWMGDNPHLTVSVDNPEEVSRTGIEQYFRQQQIPVRVNGGCEINRWTISVRGDMEDVESVSQQITHAIERNRLRSGQTGVLQQRLEMNLA